MSGENQPLPGDGGPRRHCGNCAFARDVQLPPPNIGRQRYCHFNPPSVALIPVGPGQANLTPVFPPVNDSMLCHQHRLGVEVVGAPGNEKTAPQEGQAN